MGNRISSPNQKAKTKSAMNLDWEFDPDDEETARELDFVDQQIIRLIVNYTELADTAAKDQHKATASGPVPDPQEDVAMSLNSDGHVDRARIAHLVAECKIQKFIQYLDTAIIPKGKKSVIFRDPVKPKPAEYNVDVLGAFKCVIEVLTEEYENLKKLKAIFVDEAYLQKLNYFCYKFCGFRDTFLHCCIEARLEEQSETQIVKLWADLGNVVLECTPDVIKMHGLNNATILALVHIPIWRPSCQVVYYWGPTSTEFGHLALASGYEQNEVSHWPEDTPNKATQKVGSLKNTFEQDVDSEHGPPQQVVLIPEAQLIRKMNIVGEKYKDELRNRAPLTLVEQDRQFVTKFLKDRLLQCEFRKTGLIFKGGFWHQAESQWSLQNNCANAVEKYLKSREFYPNDFKLVSTPWDTMELIAKTVLNEYLKLWENEWSDNYKNHRPETCHYLSLLLNAKTSANPPKYNKILRNVKETQTEEF